jgi:hypothetical protein
MPERPERNKPHPARDRGHSVESTLSNGKVERTPNRPTGLTSLELHSPQCDAGWSSRETITVKDSAANHLLSLGYPLGVV